MGKVMVMLSVSLDGCFEGPGADLSWHMVDDELHRDFNDTLRGMGAFIEGRVMFEMMDAYWPTADQEPDATEVEKDFSRMWRETPKYVYSRMFESSAPDVTVVREVSAEHVEQLKDSFGDLSLGGPHLAAEFQR